MLPPAALAAPMPSVLWVELTSKCPFDCVFCSRKLERGAGEHMDFDMFRRLIVELDRPTMIRLNYSGESAHYPRLMDAIRIAADTGAQTEMVTALASFTAEQLQAVAASRLGRLSISLHTLDAKQFREIYRFASLEQMLARVAELRSYRGGPEIDFAFVAMESNLDQLEAVAEFARQAGGSCLSVHPVIRRSAIPFVFASEQQPDFLGRVCEAAARAGAVVARPEAAAQPCAGLTTCEQNPWETAHVLANGDVVACEVMDRIPLGNLKRQTLREIWHGPAYADLRERYLAGEAPACRDCPWRRTIAWSEIASAVGGTEQGAAQRVLGWQTAPDETIAWSGRRATVVLRRPACAKSLELSGVLPGPLLHVALDGNALGTVRNEAGLPSQVAADFEIPETAEFAVLSFVAEQTWRPSANGGGPDERDLGFGLLHTGFTHTLPSAVREPRAGVIRRLLRALRMADRTAQYLPRTRLRPSRRWREPGISVVIPERDNPALLARAIASVRGSRLEEPVEVIVVVNGSPPEPYAGIAGARFVFERRAGFAAAVARGLAEARHEWVYLLNNDMTLAPDALEEAGAHRSVNTFAVASRIEVDDREETNWTTFAFEDGVVKLVELAPGERACGGLYAGGGSALFQTRLLRALLRHTRAYEPFYWEDAEWGAVAWRHGFRTVFCPRSRARHVHRATIGKLYAPGEIRRVFERNRLLFHLRHFDPRSAAEALANTDAATWAELSAPRALASLLWHRARIARAPFGPEAVRDRDKIEFDGEMRIAPDRADAVR